MRVVTLAALLPLGLLGLAPAAAAAAAAAPPAPVAQCAIGDERVAEVSGFAADGERWYAANDGGDAASVFVLTGCQVEREITGTTDPYDVEDLALAQDGTFWLSDTGDNDNNRDTIAVISLTQDGASTLYRLSYPDGPHDAEAILLDGKGVPYVVTKNPLGTAGVYRPVGQLASPGPTPLEQVATVRLTATDTPGGPVPTIVGSVTVTGGAMSADGTAVALRTYTDAYVFGVRGGDLVAALATEPVRIPLPNETQGEAIAFQPDGSLVSASEGVGQPVRVVPGVAALVAPKPPPEEKQADRPATGSGGREGLPALPAAAVTVAVVGGVFLLFRWRRRRRYR